MLLYKTKHLGFKSGHVTDAGFKAYKKDRPTLLVLRIQTAIVLQGAIACSIIYIRTDT